MASTPEFEPGWHSWEASALTTAPLVVTSSLEGNGGFDFDEEERGHVRDALSEKWLGGGGHESQRA